MWIDIGSMSGEATSNADSVSRLGRHINPLNARFDN